MSEKKTDLPAQTISSMDQFGALLHEMGSMMGSYYRSLIEADLPPELAAELVFDFHATFWERHLPDHSGGQP